MMLALIPVVGPILTGIIGGTLIAFADIIEGIPIIGPILSLMLLVVAF